MIRHHQTDQILDVLAQHQLVVFLGARGTGKTLLTKSVQAELELSGVTVIALDAAQAQAAVHLTAPLTAPLKCSAELLTSANLPAGSRIRVVIDNCEALNDHGWFPSVQDQWRGLLGERRARGRIAILLCGRPLFRHVAEGRRSPLIGIGEFVPSRPLAVPNIEAAFGVTEHLARTVRPKTGGHPYLTRQLLDAVGRDIAALETNYADFARSQRRYLLQLIDDHGTSTRAVIADLLDAARTSAVAESALIARHFGASHTLGEDTVEDLTASGLIERREGSCTLAAEILRTDRGLRQHLAAPPFTIDDEPTAEHTEASRELFRAENRLRRKVGVWLAEVDETWWPSRFAPELVREVEQRRQTEAESPAPSPADVHPIAYLSLGELVDGILDDRNWEQVFRVRMSMDARRSSTGCRTSYGGPQQGRAQPSHRGRGYDGSAARVATPRSLESVRTSWPPQYAPRDLEH